MAGDPLFQRSGKLLWSEVGSDVVALDAEGGACFGMEEVSAEIWHMLDQPQSVRTICAALIDSYEVDEATCARDVAELLDRMVEERLAVRLA